MSGSKLDLSYKVGYRHHYSKYYPAFVGLKQGGKGQRVSNFNYDALYDMFGSCDTWKL